MLRVLQGFPAMSWGAPVCGEGAPGLELGHLMFCLQWGLAVGGQSDQCHTGSALARVLGNIVVLTPGGS